MTSGWTLSLVRDELERLPLGCDFILAPDDVERLFGTDRAATARITDLAIGQGCRADFRGDELVFQKRLQVSLQAVRFDPDAAECFPPLVPSLGSGDDHPGPGCR